MGIDQVKKNILENFIAKSVTNSFKKDLNL